MNELALCIVNEGKDYLERLETARHQDARHRFALWSRRVDRAAWQLGHDFDQEFTVEQMAQAVAELDAYYQQHIKEW